MDFLSRGKKEKGSSGKEYFISIHHNQQRFNHLLTAISIKYVILGQLKADNDYY